MAKLYVADEFDEALISEAKQVDIYSVFLGKYDI